MHKQMSALVRSSYCTFNALLYAALIVVPTGSRAQKPAAPPDAALPATVGHWTCHWAQGGLRAEYDQIPLLRGGNVQLFTVSGRGLYGANAHPPACRVEPLGDGGSAYIARFHYADTNDSAVFDAEQRIEAHPSQQITFDIHAHWNGPQPVRLEWNPLRLWAYALVNAQYTSQTQTNGVVTPASAKKSAQGSQPRNNAPSIQQPDFGSANALTYQDNGTGHIDWQPRTGPLATTQLSPGWQRLLFTHTGMGDITLTATPLDEQSAAQNGEQDTAVQDASGKDTLKARAANKDAPDDLPIIYDGRGDANLGGDRIFWGGYVGATLTPGREFARRITLTVTPRPSLTPAALSLSPPVSASPSSPASSSLPPASGKQEILQRTSRLMSARLQQQTFPPTAPMQDAQGQPLIVPTPKSAKFNGSDYVVGRTLTICTQPPDLEPKGPQHRIRLISATPLKAAGPRVVAELHRLGKELSVQTGTDVRFTSSALKCDLNVFIAPGSPSASAAPASTSPTMPTMPTMEEGYRLRVERGGITLIARDDAGAFYGLQTLRQLLTLWGDGKYAFRGANILDWPSLRFRGAHIFVGKNALPFHKKLIERIFARFKLNAIVIECEYTAWKSHPELHTPNSMPPGDLRQEAAFARERFLEPIPLVNSLGHSQWMFANKQHLDLCEDPTRPYAYNASDPATYRLLFDIYAETLDIFKPRFFHIGHDEVKIPGADTFGRYPARPENIKKGVTRLLVDDTNRLADWLRARGARTMLWADMLLHESEGTGSKEHPDMSAANAPTLAEARSRRAQMPRDAIIADWRYAAGSEQRNGLEVLQKAGFETLGCAWCERGNIAGWARQAVQNHAIGTLQTTWAGYDSNERLLNTEYKQFTAYVLAAQAAWTGAGADRDSAVTPDLDVGDVFARAYRNESASRTRRGWRLDLRAASNVQIAASPNNGFPLAPYTPGAASPNAPFGSASEKDALQTLPAGIMLHSVFSPLSKEGNKGSEGSEGRIAINKDGAGLTGAANKDSTTVRAKASRTLPRPNLQSPAPQKQQTAEHTLTSDAVVFTLKARANTLVFEHACARGVEKGAIVAVYTLVYADGQRADIPLRCGYEIRALDDDAASDSFSTDAHSLRLPGASVTLRRLHWINPRPDALLDRLEFRALSPVAAPILFGVTGLH